MGQKLAKHVFQVVVPRKICELIKKKFGLYFPHSHMSCKKIIKKKSQIYQF